MDIRVHKVSNKIVQLRVGDKSSELMNKEEAKRLAAELAQVIADLLGVDDD